MKIKRKSEMLTVILYALIQYIVVGLFMVYVAFKNNSQDQMINLDSARNVPGASETKATLKLK